MVLHLIQAIMMAFAGVFSIALGRDMYKHRKDGFSDKNPVALGSISFVTLFFDTLGIGSVPPATACFKMFKLVPDDKIPGTHFIANVIPCVLSAFVFMQTIEVEILTLVAMVSAAAFGGYFGARFVSKLPVQKIQFVLGIALLIVTFIIAAQQLNLMPAGGTETGLHGWKLAAATAGAFCSGFLLNLAIPFYPTTMALTYMLGLDPRSVFPIMVTACVFLQAAGGFKYIKEGKYDRKFGLISVFAGTAGVAIAAFIVKSMPIYWLKWIICIVIVYTAILMLRSAIKSKKEAQNKIAEEA